MLLIHLMIIYVLGSGYCGTTDANSEKYSANDSNSSQNEDEETGATDNQFVLKHHDDVSMNKKTSTLPFKKRLSSRAEDLLPNKIRKYGPSTTEGNAKEQCTVVAQKNEQTNHCVHVSVIMHTSECIDHIDSKNTIDSTGQRSISSDKIVLKSTIRHVGDKRKRQITTSENFLTFKEMYMCVLSQFWHVFYGRYIDVENNHSRFYVQYDNNTFFMKSNIFEPNDDQINNIVNFIRYIHKKNTGKHSMSPVANINTEITKKTEIKKSNNQLLILDGNDWLSNLMFKYGESIKKKNKDVYQFLIVLKNVNKEDIDISSPNTEKSFKYLMNDADMFFQIIMIRPKCFLPIRFVDINRICQQQIIFFLDHDVYFKLLIFPDFVILNRDRDKFTTVIFDIHNIKKAFVCYYILQKFEIFIKPLKKLLVNDTLNMERLYESNVLFYKTYIIELYFTYLYANCFSIDCSHILRRVYLNRLLVLANSINYISISKFIEFFEYNFVDFLLLDHNILCFKSLKNMNGSDVNNITAQILLDHFLSVILANEMKIKKTIEEFIISLQIFFKNTEPVYGSHNKIQNDTMPPIIRSSTIKEDAIQQWMVELKKYFIEKTLDMTNP